MNFTFLLTFYLYPCSWTNLFKIHHHFLQVGPLVMSLKGLLHVFFLLLAPQTLPLLTISTQPFPSIHWENRHKKKVHALPLPNLPTCCHLHLHNLWILLLIKNNFSTDAEFYHLKFAPGFYPCRCPFSLLHNWFLFPYWIFLIIICYQKKPNKPGRASLPPHLYLSQVSYLNKSISYLS